MNMEQLEAERAKLVEALNRLGRRKVGTEERLSKINNEYPEQLFKFAVGELAESALDALATEAEKLLAILSEPIDQVKETIERKIKKNGLDRQRIRDIQSNRDNDLEFRKFFNAIIRQRKFHVDQEEQLRGLAGFENKAAVDRLCAELAEFERRNLPITEFSAVVTVPLFSEEPDNSEIEI